MEKDKYLRGTTVSGSSLKTEIRVLSKPNGGDGVLIERDRRLANLYRKENLRDRDFALEINKKLTQYIGSDKVSEPVQNTKVVILSKYSNRFSAHSCSTSS